MIAFFLVVLAIVQIIEVYAQLKHRQICLKVLVGFLETI